MTIIINKFIGITHPIQDMLIENKVFRESWKTTNCSTGIHAFVEVFSDQHYLYCDVCGMEVHISKVVIPDGKDKVIGK